MKKLFFRLFSISRPFPHTQKHILGILKNMKTLSRLLPAVLSFVLLLLQPALAGAPPLQWQKTFGGTFVDRSYSVEQTSDGGYIIAGYIAFSFGAGVDDVYLIKTDPNGDSQWQKTFGGGNRDYGYSVQQTSDGGYIITGSYGAFGPNSGDVYLIKTDPNGNSQWQKTFSLNSEDSGLSVRQTTDGGYIIAGHTGFSVTSGDVYLIKTDPNGNSEWQKTFGGIYGDIGNSVQQTSDGGYIITGSTNFTHYPSYYSDVYLIKTDPNGNGEWEKTFGGTNYDFGRSVRQTTDDGYIIVGYTGSFGAGEDDVYLIKTDPNGNSQWQKTFGGSEYDSGGSVQQTTDGGYIIAGGTTSYGAGDYDVYLIKTNRDGISQWQKTFGGSDDDRGGSVQQTSDGGYVIAGFTESFGAVEADFYLIKLCSDGTLSADFNCNGTVYYEDLDIMVGQWLQPPDILSADIAPEPGDGIVNFFDFAVLANDWLQTTAP